MDSKIFCRSRRYSGILHRRLVFQLAAESDSPTRDALRHRNTRVAGAGASRCPEDLSAGAAEGCDVGGVRPGP